MKTKCLLLAAVVALGASTVLAQSSETSGGSGSTTTGGTGSDSTATTTPAADRPENRPFGGRPETRPAGKGPAGGTDDDAATARPGLLKRRTLNENASDNAKAVQAVLKQFDARREQMVAQRRALLARLSAAETEEERKQILEQLRAEQRTRAEEQRALGKEIRDELKKFREQRRNGGG